MIKRTIIRRGGHRMEILHRHDLPLDGFAGVREYRLVTDSRHFDADFRSRAWDGIGNFIYLSDAWFVPKGETRMHGHREVDVISVILEGRIAHRGSLGDGQELRAGDVQVQRAGGEGLRHNEVNPDETENHMLQIWVAPEQPGLAADYRLYRVGDGDVVRVYGGPDAQREVFAAATLVDVGRLAGGQAHHTQTATLAYLASGRGIANGQPVAEGDLIRASTLRFEAEAPSVTVFIHLAATG